MANGQGGKGSIKAFREIAENSRKWYFAKEKNGEVRTLYAHNKSPIQTQDSTYPGSVAQIKCTDYSDYSGKIKVCMFFKIFASTAT